MTTPRIEEMVEEAIKIITRTPFAVTENAFFYAVTPERLEEVVTQAHQAGIDEAVEILSNLLKTYPKPLAGEIKTVKQTEDSKKSTDEDLSGDNKEF